MSNTTRHYFGAYLEIETQEGEFCPHCGHKITGQASKDANRPATVYALLGNDDDEQLASITPPSLWGKKIIAIANRAEAGTWLVADQDCEVEVLDFPTDAEVDSLKAALADTVASTITILRLHPAVLSVTVKAGYVLDTEY
jgi:hypothetical protein